MNYSKLSDSWEGHSVPLQVVTIGIFGLILFFVYHLFVRGTRPIELFRIIGTTWAIGIVFGLPYVVAAIIVSLPLYSLDVGFYHSPTAEYRDEGVRDRVLATSRHVAVGILYMLLAIVIGGLLLYSLSVGSGYLFRYDNLFSFLPVMYDTIAVAGIGGSVVGATYVTLQLRRYTSLTGTVSPRRKIGTVVLGCVITFAPAFSYVVYNVVVGFLSPY
jgi:hypothetical protein